MSTTAALIGVCLALVGLATVITLTIARPREATRRRSRVAPLRFEPGRPIRSGQPTRGVPQSTLSNSADAASSDGRTPSASERGG